MKWLAHSVIISLHKIWTSPTPKGLNKVSDLFKIEFLHIIRRKCPALFYMLKYIPEIHEVYDKAVTCNRWNLRYVPDYFRTKERCIKAVEKNPWLLWYVPDHLKTQEICDAAVEKNLWGLDYVPGRFKTKEMCDKVEDHSPYMLHDIPDCIKTQEMCIKVVCRRPRICPQSS